MHLIDPDEIVIDYETYPIRPLVPEVRWLNYDKHMYIPYYKNLAIAEHIYHKYGEELDDCGYHILYVQSQGNPIHLSLCIEYMYTGNELLNQITDMAVDMSKSKHWSPVKSINLNHVRYKNKIYLYYKDHNFIYTPGGKLKTNKVLNAIDIVIAEELYKVDDGKLDYHIKRLFENSGIDRSLPKEEIKKQYKAFFAKYVRQSNPPAKYVNKVWKRIEIIFNI